MVSGFLNLYKPLVQLDEINGNTLWRDAINKEMSKAKVSRKTLVVLLPMKLERAKLVN